MAVTFEFAATARNVAQTLGAWIEGCWWPRPPPDILILVAVLGLDAADRGRFLPVAGQLEHEFGINNIEMGLLIAVVSFLGALASIPMGVLADRANRRNILTLVILLWAVAMLVSGTAPV